MHLQKFLILLSLLFLPRLIYAQVSFGINSGVGIGFNAPENFSPKPKYSMCSGRGQIKYSVFLYNKHLFFKRSENQGLSWSDSLSVFAIPSATSTMVNNRRIDTEPRIACDLSDGEYANRIYIVWSDLKNGKKNLDVFLMYSDDNGQQWTEPILLSYHPNHKHQLMPELIVDPKTGTLYVLYVDQQNFLTEQLCDIQFAYSTNGGLKFTSQCINTEALKFSGALQPQFSLSEYGVKALWFSSSEGLLLELPFKHEVLRGKPLVQLENKSYTFTNTLTIVFELLQDTKLSAELSKPLDAGFQKILFKKKKHKKGKNSLSLEPYFLNLPEDNYILTLYDENGNTFAWITLD